MTCVAGLKTDSKVYIGADSLGSNGSNKSVRKDAKVFEVDEFIIGFTDSFRMGQLLQYKLLVPLQPRSMTDHEYMTTVFIDEVRKVFKDNGFTRYYEDSQECGGLFLVAYKGELYRIDSDFQVGIPEEGYAAIGSGGEVASGAIYALLKNTDMEPENIIAQSIFTASEITPFVGGPITIISQEYDEEAEKLLDIMDSIKEMDDETLSQIKEYVMEISGLEGDSDGDISIEELQK